MPLDGLLDVAAGAVLRFQVIEFDAGVSGETSATGGLKLTFGL